MFEIGKYALLANISGNVTSCMIAWGVSILVVRKVMAVNNEARPKLMRNTMANTPNTLNTVKLAPNCKPIRYAKPVTMPAWNMERMLADSTFEVIMTERDTGVLKTLFMKPNLRSKTTDMPTNADVNTVVKATMPIAM